MKLSQTDFRDNIALNLRLGTSKDNDEFLVPRRAFVIQSRGWLMGLHTIP